MTQHGFKIHDMPEHVTPEVPQYHWRRVNVFDFTIEHHPNCPIDGTPMETIAALVSLTLPETIRVGCCPRCGIVGYIDRPSQADIDRYYAETWMGQSVGEAIAIAAGVAESEPNRKDAETLASLPVDRDLPVLEIGCGYGRTIHALQQAGFRSIDATEHCPARAEAVREIFGVNVTEDMPQKRYGLIVSSHVIEHVSDPAGLIRACAERQEQGDWMIHSLPDFFWEPSVGILLFLPHLWSFKTFTFREMLWLAGYGGNAPADGTSQVSFMGAKGADKKPDATFLHVEQSTHKLLRGLGLIPQRSVLSWQRDSDGCAWKSMPYAQQAAVNNFPRSIVVEPIQEYRTAAPIEVQFADRIKAFVK